MYGVGEVKRGLAKSLPRARQADKGKTPYLWGCPSCCRAYRRSSLVLHLLLLLLLFCWQCGWMPCARGWVWGLGRELMI